ncbi:hypothetical protein BGZ46_003667 [Entomortierella lignicola]|nr:hypothetical protein BGZ46_003667 [Entomortierella lignicola]
MPKRYPKDLASVDGPLLLHAFLQHPQYNPQIAFELSPLAESITEMSSSTDTIQVTVQASGLPAFDNPVTEAILRESSSMDPTGDMGIIESRPRPSCTGPVSHEAR